MAQRIYWCLFGFQKVVFTIIEDLGSETLKRMAFHLLYLALQPLVFPPLGLVFEGHQACNIFSPVMSMDGCIEWLDLSYLSHDAT